MYYTIGNDNPITHQQFAVPFKLNGFLENK